MRIAFVMQPWDVVGPADNGGGTSVSSLTYQIARRMCGEHAVVICSKQAHALPASEVDANGISHHRVDLRFENRLMLPVKLLDRLPLPGSSSRPFYSSPLFYPGYVRNIARYLSEWRPDVVHIHNFSQYIPVLRRFLPQARIIIHMHCEWLSQLDAGTIEKRLRQADRVVGCSQHITGKVRDRFPSLADRCSTVTNAVDLSHFTPGRGGRSHGGGKTLLCVGRVSPEKGIHLVLEAFGRVLDRFPDTRLSIVGSIGSAPAQYMVRVSDDARVRALKRFYPGLMSHQGHYFERLKRWLPPEKMKQVSFVGPVAYGEVNRFYQESDIYVCASLSEAFGMPVVEAMASGVPVVVARTGGLPEIVENGETGLIVDPDDPAGLAVALERLLADDALADGLRHRAMEAAKGRFSWERVTGELLAEYQLTVAAA